MNQQMKKARNSDEGVFGAIDRELNRQQSQIELIASENIVSQAVLAAQGAAPALEGANVHFHAAAVIRALQGGARP